MAFKHGVYHAVVALCSYERIYHSTLELAAWGRIGGKMQNTAHSINRNFPREPFALGVCMVRKFGEVH